MSITNSRYRWNFEKPPSDVKGRIQLFLLISAFMVMASSDVSAETEAAPSVSVEPEKSLIETPAKNRLSLDTFTEWMAPALTFKSSSVPKTDGTALDPTNSFNMIRASYEFTDNYHALVWQKVIIPFAPSKGLGPTLNPVPKDTRFGVRRTQVFANPNLRTKYDLYFQPGMVKDPDSNIEGRAVDFGIRTDTAYSIPGSKWDIGLINELYYTFYKDGGKGQNIGGMFATWGSYSINSTFSTQHFIMTPFKHLNGTWQWDYPLQPYIQNGVGMNVSKAIFVSALLNNYLLTAPKLENTWASLWLSFKVL